jgi:hypothetical protein
VLKLLIHLKSDYNQDPYPEETLVGNGLYYRPDATFEDVSSIEVEIEDGK